MYAILDIETTGGKFNEEGITEIAIYKYDGHEIVDQFITLVNPEKEIQDFVVKLTGINNKMLINAPKFHEIAKRIIEITTDCTLVAHNAAFDYRILRTEYNRLGYNFQRNTVCTVELSKKLIPDQPSYSLGKLCRGLGIPTSDRHRANGDAVVTVKLFKLLLEKDIDKNIIKDNIKYFDKREEKFKLQKILDELPEKEGVFYVHNIVGNVIYMGRGKSIKKEVNKLFLKDSRRFHKIKSKLNSVTYEETGNNLFTKLKYYLELDSIKPKYNIIRKRKLTAQDFNHNDFIVYHKGRIPEENAVILIENNIVVGFGYTNLSFQENQREILKNILTPISNKLLAKTIIKNHLSTHKVSKIVRFE